MTTTKTKLTTTTTKISITSPTGNPLFDCITVGTEDEGGGSYLKIDSMLDDNESSISFDWNEWDAIVEVVKKYRKQWEW